MNVLDCGEIGDFFVPKGLLVTGGGSSNTGYIVDWFISLSELVWTVKIELIHVSNLISEKNF